VGNDCRWFCWCYTDGKLSLVLVLIILFQQLQLEGCMGTWGIGDRNWTLSPTVPVTTIPPSTLSPLSLSAATEVTNFKVNLWSPCQNNKLSTVQLTALVFLPSFSYRSITAQCLHHLCINVMWQPHLHATAVDDVASRGMLKRLMVKAMLSS